MIKLLRTKGGPAEQLVEEHIARSLPVQVKGHWYGVQVLEGFHRRNVLAPPSPPCKPVWANSSHSWGYQGVLLPLQTHCLAHTEVDSHKTRPRGNLVAWMERAKIS